MYVYTYMMRYTRCEEEKKGLCEENKILDSYMSFYLPLPRSDIKVGRGITRIRGHSQFIPLYSPDPWEFGSLPMSKANSNFNSETYAKMSRIPKFSFLIYE